MSATAPARSSPGARRSRRVGIAIALLVVGLVLLLVRWPHHQPFDYIRDRAIELGRDPARIREHVRALELLPYRGDLKGALGTLFGGAGSPEEKLALLRALLAHTPEAPGANLDDVAPGLSSGAPAAATEAPAFQLAILHRRDGGADTPVFRGPVGALVGDVHSSWVERSGRRRIEIRASTGTSSHDIDLAGAPREALRFEIEMPGRSTPLVLERELWPAVLGDRCDFVVLPCRISPYVRQQECVVLTQRGRRDAPEMPAYDALLEYALRADLQLAHIERQRGVRAIFDVPRILMLDRRGPGAQPMAALDLRLDETSFAGAPEDVALARVTRSLLASAGAHAFLGQWLGGPTESAFDVFASLGAGGGRTAAERQAAVEATLAVLGEMEPQAQATFAMGASEPVRVQVESGRAQVEGIEQPLSGGAADVAAAIESWLVSHAGGPFPHEERLVIDIDPGAEPLVVALGQLVHRFERGGTAVEQRVQISSTTPGLDYLFHTRAGMRLARGSVSIDGAALNTSLVHDPQYRSGIEKRTRATSLCVSRQVLSALRAGETVPFQLLAPRGVTDDPSAERQIAWSGELEPAGRATQRVEVNGRAIDLPVIAARLAGPTPPVERLLILDEEQFPVGRVDALVRATTAVRARLRDEHGEPIGGAIVEVRPPDQRPTSAMTWPDGRLRFPPPREGFSHGRVALHVRQLLLGEENQQVVEVDWTAPGIEEHALSARRLTLAMCWLGEVAAAATLRVDENVRQHIERELAAGRVVVAPERGVPRSRGSPANYAAYVLDPQTGELHGLLGDGLRGSRVPPPQVPKLSVDKPSRIALPDAETALPKGETALPEAETWGFSARRLDRHDRAKTYRMLREALARWDRRTDLFAGTPPIDGASRDAVRSALERPALERARTLLRAGHTEALALLAEWERAP